MGVISVMQFNSAHAIDWKKLLFLLDTVDCTHASPTPSHHTLSYPTLPYHFPPSYQVSVPSNNIAVTVTRFTEVSDLSFKFYDHVGNEARLNKAKSLELRICLMSDGNPAVVKAKVLPDHALVFPLIKFSRVFALLKEADLDAQDEITLQVTSSYKTDKALVSLVEGRITCSQVQLNTVKAVNMTLLRAVKGSKKKKGKGGAAIEQEEDRADDGEGNSCYCLDCQLLAQCP